MASRGILHHLVLTVSSLRRSAPFYAAVLTDWGYSKQFDEERYQDWKRWDLEGPHRITLVEGNPAPTNSMPSRGGSGLHHTAFCANDRADVDRFYREVLVPLAAEGFCSIEDAPCDCPEYEEGYYATFFRDPDGLKFEFVFTPSHLKARNERRP